MSEGVRRGVTDGKTSANRSTDDAAWQNEFTEEDVTDPAVRDDVAKDLVLDPDIVNEEPVLGARDG